MQDRHADQGESEQNEIDGNTEDEQGLSHKGTIRWLGRTAGYLAGLKRLPQRPAGAGGALGNVKRKLERAKGFEPSTPTLARLCSTPELHPRPAGEPAAPYMDEGSSNCNRATMARNPL